MKDEIERENPRDQGNCPNCDHNLDEPINDIWKDPNVKAALKDGRPADDISVISCPRCGRFGYYNQGSHFWCRFCEQGWEVLTEGEEPPLDRQYFYLDHFMSLTDTVTDVTDGYPNNTQVSEPNL
jgi:hypothetical protein